MFIGGFNWLQTNGANTNGAAAKVTSLDRLDKRYSLAFWGIYIYIYIYIERERELTGVPKSLSVKNMQSAVTPSVLTLFVPFRVLPNLDIVL